MFTNTHRLIASNHLRASWAVCHRSDCNHRTVTTGTVTITGLQPPGLLPDSRPILRLRSADQIVFCHQTRWSSHYQPSPTFLIFIWFLFCEFIFLVHHHLITHRFPLISPSISPDFIIAANQPHPIVFQPFESRPVSIELCHRPLSYRCPSLALLADEIISFEVSFEISFWWLSFSLISSTEPSRFHTVEFIQLCGLRRLDSFDARNLTQVQMCFCALISRPFVLLRFECQASWTSNEPPLWTTSEPFIRRRTVSTIASRVFETVKLLNFRLHQWTHTNSSSWSLPPITFEFISKFI